MFNIFILIIFECYFCSLTDIIKSSTHLMNKGDVFYSSSVQILRRQIKLVIVSSVTLKAFHTERDAIVLLLLFHACTLGGAKQQCIFSSCSVCISCGLHRPLLNIQH